MSRNAKIAIVSVLVILLLALVPLFALPGASFGGSDDAGSAKVEEITGKSYEPWFTPVLEQILGGELPGEVESLFFCVQTGLGVGVLAFAFGYLTARKKYGGSQSGGAKKKGEGGA